MDTYEKKYKGALARCKWLLSEGMISKIAATDMFRELMDNDSENIRKEIINIFHSLADGKIPVDINYADIFTWLENIPYTIDHEKREGFHLGYKAALENQGEQNPAEWSEKDESLRLRTIGALETCKIGSPTKCVDEQINWLKSLKQRYTWKPSDEQMEALDSVIDEYDGYPEFDSLVSLKNDLSKL